MEIYPKLVLSRSNLENLLEPPCSWVMTMEFPLLPLFMYNLAYVIKVSFKELSKVSPLTLSADPKA
jgi:hypothetical protein